MKKQVNVLQITVGGHVFTGVASFLTQYYRGINKDKVHFDFLFCTENSMQLVENDPLFADSKFIVLHAAKNNSSQVVYPVLARKLAAVLRKNHYDIVHINTSAVGSNLCCALTARLCGVKTVIAHSHNTKVVVPKNAHKRNPILQRAIDTAKGIGPFLFRTCCHAMFACSDQAGITLFGQKGIRHKNYSVIRNAISADKYRYSPEEHNAVRAELGVSENTLVLGHIGRMVPEKNHLLMVDILDNVRRTHPNAQLWFIGDGPERENIAAYAESKGLADSVKLLGQKNDVYRYLQGMDVFLFPSVNEGLGLVAIEAQAAGLPTYASDTIPRDTLISDLIQYLPLTQSADAWADKILADKAWTKPRRDMYQIVADHGFDISESVHWLENYYISRVK